MEGIRISVEPTGAGKDIYVIKIAGYIDTTTSSELERVLQSLLREQRFKMVVDLKDVDYISSAGWGIFISEIKNIRTHQGDLKLANMSDTVSEVYELLEFSTILVAAKTVADAVRLFSGEPAAAATAGAKPAGTKIEPAKPGQPAPAAVLRPQPAVKPPQAPSRPASMPAPAAARPQVPVSNAAPAPVKPGTSGIPAPAKAPVPGNAILSLIDRIHVLVKAHPDWGAWKLKKELNRLRGSQPKVSWGEVRTELKYNQLSGKRERFKFARE